MSIPDRTVQIIVLVPESLRQRIKVVCAMKDITMKEFQLRALLRAVEEAEQEEAYSAS